MGKQYGNYRQNYGNRNSNYQNDFKSLNDSLKYKDHYLNFTSVEAKKVLDDIIDEIENKFVKEYASSISSSQLRNIFNKIKNVKNSSELKLLRPNLAYIAARQQDQKKSKESIQFIDELIRKVDDSNLDGFKQFMEIVVAYHKYYS